MAKKLQIGEWVGLKAGVTKDVKAIGYITKNLGEGYFSIQYTDPMTKDIKKAHANRLVRLECELDANQQMHLTKLFTDLALDTNDHKWLKELTGNEMA